MTALLADYSSNRWFALALDLVLVIVFAIVGRASHDESLSIAGVAGTAWPFVIACLIGWVIVTALGMRFALIWPAGAIIWVVTVAGGLGLRVLTGGGAATAFVIVTTLVLAVFLLLPRLLLGRRRLSPSRTRDQG